MSEDFARLVQQFASLRYNISPSAEELSCIREWLIELNQLSYFKSNVDCGRDRSMLLVNVLSSIVPHHDPILVELTASLLIKLIEEQQIVLAGNTLLAAIEWCLVVFHYGTDSKLFDVRIYATVLKTLEALVRDNVNLRNDRNSVLAIMRQFPHVYTMCQRVNEPHISHLKVPLVCALEAIIGIGSDAPQYLEELDMEYMLQFFVAHLTFGEEIPVRETCDEAYRLSEQDRHVVRCALSGMRSLVQARETPLGVEPLTCLLLGFCRSYMVYDLSGVPLLPPQKLPKVLADMAPTTTAGPARLTSPANRLPRPRRRRHGARLPADSGQSDANMSCMSTTSYNPYVTPHVSSNFAAEVETEVGDTIRTPQAQLACNIRLQALLLLQCILNKIDKRMLLEHFVSFMQTNPLCEAPVPTLPSGHNLLTSMAKDPSPRCRLAAQLCLQIFLTEGRLMLLDADHHSNPEQISFSQRCHIMANVVAQLHFALCLAMNEPSHSVLTQVLKTTAHLVRGSNYERLSPGLCVKLVRNVKQLVGHANTSVQVGALTVLGCLLSHQNFAEVENAFVLTNMAANPAVESVTDALLPRLPWLINQCFFNLHVENVVPSPVKIESLQIIGVMCERYFEKLIYPYLGSVGSALVSAFNDSSSQDVLHHANKAMVQLGEAINANHQMVGCIDGSLTIWQEFLEAPLTFLVNSTFPAERAGAADCIGAIGDHCFKLLPMNLQLKCITVMLSLVPDQDINVRSSAVRGIGILLLYQSAQSDGFLEDASKIIVGAMTDASAAVRVRASWALGNYSDALIESDDVPIGADVIHAAILGSRDQDKIRCNAVRALGILLKLLEDSDDFDAGDKRKWLHEGVDALLHCARNATLMKARWNACYALGNVLKSAYVYAQDQPDGVRISMRIFFALGWILTECNNIKVRINAAMAVISCTTRANFADNFLPLWGSLVNGLITVENIVDAHECGHRDKLVIQTCVTLGHMTRLVIPQDLEMLADVVADGADILLYKQVQYVYNRLLPEQYAPLFNASAHLAELSNLPLPDCARKALGVLRTIFNYREES